MKNHLPHIVFPDPQAKAGQKSVLGLQCDPIPLVRIAFIGIGMRVPSAIKRFMHIEGVVVKALCDIVAKNLQKGIDILKAHNIDKVDSYTREDDWKIICERNDIDLIYISTHYDLHTPIAVHAMQHGKHVAIEVPAATTIEDCWKLVDTAEQTQRHCMMLENCNYGTLELASLQMIKKGVLGEIVHGEGAYIHDLKKLIFDQEQGYWNMWRLNHHAEKNGNLYPTHGLGPICHSMNIHRGDKLHHLVSMSSAQLGLTQYAIEQFGEDSDFAHREYKNGDMNSSLLKTAKGRTILLQHDITSPRPYSRIHKLSGTKGFIHKWPRPGMSLAPNGMEYLSEEEFRAMQTQYEHPVYTQVKPKLAELSGKVCEIAKNEGMDYIMDFRLMYCLQNGLPLDMDVYDAAEWSCMVELSEYSANNYSMPVQIPDFTRGKWNELSKVEYHFKK
jgi:predicted dehydrogenase